MRSRRANLIFETNTSRSGVDDGVLDRDEFTF